MFLKWIIGRIIVLFLRKAQSAFGIKNKANVSKKDIFHLLYIHPVYSIHVAFASARLRLQPHGGLRDGADDEGETVFCWLQH